MANSFDTSFLFLSFSFSGRPRLDKSLVQISLTWKWKWSSVEKSMEKSACSLPALHFAGLLSLSVNREISLFPSQPCFLFQLKTNQHRKYLRLRHSQLWARCHLSFRCPTVWQAGTVFAPTRQPVQALASILRSVNASVTNLILYRSI